MASMFTTLWKINLFIFSDCDLLIQQFLFFNRRPRVGRKVGRAGHILRKWIEFFLIVMQLQQNDWQTKKQLAPFFGGPLTITTLGNNDHGKDPWTLSFMMDLWSGLSYVM